MNKPRMQPRWPRVTMAALAATVLAGSASCNLLSGASSIDFTGEPTSSSSGGGSGGGGGRSGSGGGDGGGGADAGDTLITVACNDSASDFAYAMAGYYDPTGPWITQFALACISVDRNGNLGSGYASMFAGPVARSGYLAVCDLGQVVVRVEYTYDDSHVYQIRIACQFPSTFKATGIAGPWHDFVGEAPALPLTTFTSEIIKSSALFGLDTEVHAGQYIHFVGEPHTRELP